MLKITIQEGPEDRKVLLDGKLAGDWVKELEQVWQGLLASSPDRNVTLDLAGVTFVDSEGKKLLSSMLGRGAKVQKPQLLVKYIVDEMQAAQRNPTS
jgi:anti-anti-sigma regulatory factor